MDIRAVIGYLAHVLLAGYWAWVLTRTAPELRRGTRDRALRARVLLVKSAGIVLTALVVSVIHFWATHVWHVLVAVPVAVAAGVGLRRYYRRLVAAPRHRLPLGQRVRRAGHLHVIAPPHVRTPAHRLPPAFPAARRIPAPGGTPAFPAQRAASPGELFVPSPATGGFPPPLSAAEVTAPHRAVASGSRPAQPGLTG